MKRASVFTACLFIMAALAGCAETGDWTKIGDMYLTGYSSGDMPVAVYHPKLPAGIATTADARKDLARLLENRESSLDFFFYSNYCAQHGLQRLILSAHKSGDFITLERLITKGRGDDVTYVSIDGPPSRPFAVGVVTKTIFVRDDMLEFNSRLFVLYADLPDWPITVQAFANGQRIYLGGHQVSIGLPNEEEAHRVADDLYFIQQRLAGKKKAQRSLFESQVAKYRALKVKPHVSEEQRKLIVQANYFSEQKEYGRAIDCYKQAIAVDPVAYPAAYFNLALLSAQEHYFRSAIRYMKQYLVLVPDARDARSAQDKIYEWDAAIGE